MAVLPRRFIVHSAIVCAIVATPAGWIQPGAAGRLAASVAPTLSYAPTAVRVTITIEPQTDNRSAVVELESADQFRSSEFPLDGERAARTHETTYADLPAGHYVVRVRLLDGRGETSVAMTQFSVLRRQ